MILTTCVVATPRTMIDDASLMNGPLPSFCGSEEEGKGGESCRGKAAEAIVEESKETKWRRQVDRSHLRVLLLRLALPLPLPTPPELHSYLSQPPALLKYIYAAKRPAWILADRMALSCLFLRDANWVLDLILPRCPAWRLRSWWISLSICVSLDLLFFSLHCIVLSIARKC